MNDDKSAFALASRDESAPAPVLAGVRATGRLDGVLFDLTLRQTYRNTSDRVLEVVYTFPLPPHSVLLGFASELNGARQVGTVVAKRAAERQYEVALADGDAPVMLEALGDGLHTANIGNLKPGDELVLEVRFVQLQRMEQGRIRLAIPTTIAPRYGNPAAAGLQPQQVPQSSLAVEYPLDLSVTVGGTLERGSVECPTHRFTRTAAEDGLRLDLAPGAWLDRDVVVVVHPREPMPSLVIQAHDAVSATAPVVMLAALQPPLAEARKNIVLKLLVDCSGSMGGDSMACARVVLQSALAGLTDQDHASVSRFGSTTEHLLSPTPCTPATLRRLKPMVDGIDADLGGTEMVEALKAVFALRVPDGSAGSDVLLLTDGEIWNADEVIAAARASRHRVFAVGVGSAPASGVLRSLAEATGGACEFATPGESLHAAAARMLVRIRQPLWRQARIEWGTQPTWQTPLPANVFGGDTVIGFAGLPPGVPAPRVRLMATNEHGVDTELARGEAVDSSPGDVLARMACASRLEAANDEDVRVLAVSYQLMSEHTNCILVHERAEADKSSQEAELHRVRSMLAAGWGGVGSVTSHAPHADSLSIAPVVIRMSSHAASPSPKARFSRHTVDGSAFESMKAREDLHRPAWLDGILATVVEHLSSVGTAHGLAVRCIAFGQPGDVQRAVDRAVDLGLDVDEAWLLLAHWANSHAVYPGESASADALRVHLAGIDATLTARCLALYESLLGGYSSDVSLRSRAMRLQQALTRSPQ